VLADEWLAAPAQEAAEDNRDDHDIVQLTGNGDEVRHQIEGEGEIAREREQQRLLASRDARVLEQPAAEDDAVWNEAGEGAGTLPSAGDDEREDEGRVQEEEDAERDERPRQEVHEREASRGLVQDDPASSIRC
jgi:hypothetical protein